MAWHIERTELEVNSISIQFLFHCDVVFRNKTVNSIFLSSLQCEVASERPGAPLLSDLSVSLFTQIVFEPVILTYAWTSFPFSSLTSFFAWLF